MGWRASFELAIITSALPRKSTAFPLQRVWLAACFLVAFAFSPCAHTAIADQIYSASQSDINRGHFDQNAQTNSQYLLNDHDKACAPTSVANSFVFLQDRWGITGLGGADPTSANGYAPISYDTINELETYMKTGTLGGTTEDIAKGKEEYLQDNADAIKDKNGNPVAIQTVGQSFYFSQAANGPWVGGITQQKPTAEFIAQQLADGEDVEMSFNWPQINNDPPSAHMVNIYAINYNATTNSGSISFIDPTSSTDGFLNNGTGDAPAIQSATLMKDALGFLEFTYKGGASGVAADDNFHAASTGTITDVLAESPVSLEVPSPSSGKACILLLGLLVIHGGARRISNAALRGIFLQSAVSS